MTEPNQNAFEAALQFDLAAARQQVAAVTDQLRAAEARNEAHAHRIDWLTAEVARVTASREQYERVGIRASAMLEGGTSMMIKLLQDLQGEIKAAAFTEVPGKVADAPEDGAKPEKAAPSTHPSAVGIPATEHGQIANPIDAGIQIFRAHGFDVPSASRLPTPRIGNGAGK